MTSVRRRDRAGMIGTRRAVTVMVAALAMAGCGDSDDPLPSGPATVEVRSAVPALRTVCIGDTCGETDGDGRFTVDVDAVVTYEVLLEGESAGFGTSGEIGPGRCVLVTYGDGSVGSDVGGCDADDG